MNPFALISRVLRDLDALRAGLLGRLDRLNRQLERLRDDIALLHRVVAQLDALRDEMQPIQELAPVRAELEAVRAAVEPLSEKLDQLRDDVKPIQQIAHLRAGIEPLDEDMRHVRESIDAIEPFVSGIGSAVERLDSKLATMGADLSPVADLAGKMPGVSR